MSLACPSPAAHLPTWSSSMDNSDPLEMQLPPTIKRRIPTFLTLPVELHLLVTQHLTYPDALSLKHTNQYFYGLVYTGVNLKIEWLIERRRLHLDCPHDKKCELGSDMRFCRGSVRLLMKRRREHGECDTRVGGRGCLVFGTRVCTFRKKEKRIVTRVKRWMNEHWRVVFALLALLGLVFAWLWMGIWGDGRRDS